MTKAKSAHVERFPRYLTGLREDLMKSVSTPGQAAKPYQQLPSRSRRMASPPRTLALRRFG